MRIAKFSAVVAAWLLGSCASDDRAEPVRPLPYAGPQVIGEPPLASMAEFRRPFVARGTTPEWRATVRPGEARLILRDQPEQIIRLTLPQPCFVVGCDGAYFDTHGGRRALILDRQPCRLSPSGPTMPFKAIVLRPRDDGRPERLLGCARPVRARK
jgi:hypothetical protein